MTDVARLVLRLNLERSFDPWLALLAAGDYAVAERLAQWRVDAQAALSREQLHAA